MGYIYFCLKFPGIMGSLLESGPAPLKSNYMWHVDF